MLATDLKTGTIYKEGKEPWLVLKYNHIKTARGGANVKVKARNLITGSVMEKSYLSSAKIEDAHVSRKSAQYLYRKRDFVFMDPDTYAQFTIPDTLIEEHEAFLREGENVQVLYFEDGPISVEFPNNMTFEITYTEPGYRGNTVTNVYKDATLDNGLVVKVPPFLKVGDKVKIDTRTREYLSKA